MSIEYAHRMKELEFSNQESDRNVLLQKIESLTQEMKCCNSWIRRNKIQSDIISTKKKVQQLEDNETQKSYYLSIANIVKEYNQPEYNPETTGKVYDDSIKPENSSIMEYIVKKEGRQNKALFDKFNHVVNNVNLHQEVETTEKSYYCSKCNHLKVLIQNESNLVCEYCGDVEYFLDNTQGSVTYEQEVNTESNINHGIYKRMSHFSDILSNCQAKNNVSIPESIIDDIRNEMKKRQMKTIEYKNIKPILKKLGYSKYYEQIPKIYSIVSEETILQIPEEVEEQLKIMFRMIQDPFEKHKPKSRSNFLSYSYCFFQLLSLLDQKQYTLLFPLLKSREKIREQDKIWKDICDELNWEYTPAPIQ